MGSQSQLQGPDLTAGVSISELAEGQAFIGHAAGEAVLLVRQGNEIHAIGGTCTHYGAPLVDGVVVGNTVRCPWHHACFDLRTGSATAPALAPVACWQVERRGDRVHVTGKREVPRPKPARGPSSVAIVGAGAAGAACALSLRDRGYEGLITLIGAEGTGPVDSTNLSKNYLAGDAPEEWIPLRGDDDWRALKVDLLANDAVTALDAGARRLTLASGRTLTADAIVLATGAEPIRLNIPGNNLPHVHVLRTLADSRAIIAAATSGRRAVVLGASFIALEVAASLRTRGVEVDVVAPESIPLARVMGDDLGREIHAAHEAHGVRFHLGITPTAIESNSVKLSNGKTLPADLVVMGVGVRPRTALAEAAGLRMDRGVVVDDHLRTSAPGIWACGDIARYPDARSGSLVRIEHWVVAERHGQAVARSLTGDLKPFREVPFFWSSHYDITVGYVGYAERFDRAEIVGDLKARDALVVYRQGGRIQAVALINRDKVGLEIEAAMERGDEAALERLVR